MSQNKYVYVTNVTYDNHGLCGTNKLLYKRCAKLMGRSQFRSPTAPTFLILRLHDQANMEQTSSKCIQNTRANCSTFARSCKWGYNAHTNPVIDFVQGTSSIFCNKLLTFYATFVPQTTLCIRQNILCRFSKALV